SQHNTYELRGQPVTGFAALTFLRVACVAGTVTGASPVGLFDVFHEVETSLQRPSSCAVFFFFQAEDGIRDFHVTGVQTCALPISYAAASAPSPCGNISST